MRILKDKADETNKDVKNETNKDGGGKGQWSAWKVTLDCSTARK